MALFGEKYGEIVRTVHSGLGQLAVRNDQAASCLTPNIPTNSAAERTLTALQTSAHSSSSVKVLRRQAFAALKRSQAVARTNSSTSVSRP